MPPDPADLPDSTEEALTADQLAAHATVPAPGHAPTHTHCQNCGTELRGRYCHHCGQHDFDFHRSFGHLLHEALENFFHFDAKFFRNIVTLLFRPGRLSADFNAGKRAAQMPPFRLYLFVSVLFFFLIYLGVDEGAEAFTHSASPKSVPTAVQSTDHEPAEKAQAEAAARKLSHRLATDQQHASTGPKPKSELERYLTEKSRHVLEHPEAIQEHIIHALPKMLLVCLPFFALYTRLLFRRATPFYLAHLVIALHFHTFIFLWRLFGDGWTGLCELVSPALAGWVGFGLKCWLVLYPVLMLRELFHESWRRTLVKAAALAFTYGLTIILAFGITAIAVFFML